MPDHGRLPHLHPFVQQPIVFLTVVTHERCPLLGCAPAHEILRNLWLNSPAMDGWTVGRYVLMPDHVHLFACATREAKPLSRWVQTWKSLSGRQLAAALNQSPPVWQKNYFDRYLRTSESYSEKWDYVVQNPVRKGLVRTAVDWPWQGVLEDLMF